MTRSRKRSEAAFTVAAEPAQVRTRLKGVDRVLPQFSVTSVEAFEARLSRRANLFTWGETIAIRWSPNGQGVDVSVVLDAKFPTALGDYGQGRRDIETLFHVLTEGAIAAG